MKLLTLVAALYSMNAFSYWKVMIQENNRDKSPLIISNHQSSGTKLIMGHQCLFTQVGNARNSSLQVQCQRGDQIMNMVYPCMGADNNEFTFSKDRASMYLNIKCYYM